MYNSIKIFILTRIPTIALLLFSTFILISIILYPGSTYLDESTIGYDFFKNFLSDLGRTNTFNGVTNYFSCFFFNCAMFISGFLFFSFYVCLPHYFKEGIFYNVSITGSFFGAISCICFIGTALTPADLYLDAHIFFANKIFYFAFPATLIYSLVIIKTSSIQTFYGFGYFTFAIALISYIIILEFGPDPKVSNFSLLFQATSQKIITICFILSTFMLSRGINRSRTNVNNGLVEDLKQQN